MIFIRLSMFSCPFICDYVSQDLHAQPARHSPFGRAPAGAAAAWLADQSAPAWSPPLPAGPPPAGARQFQPVPAVEQIEEAIREHTGVAPPAAPAAGGVREPDPGVAPMRRVREPWSEQVDQPAEALVDSSAESEAEVWRTGNAEGVRLCRQVDDAVQAELNMYFQRPVLPSMFVAPALASHHSYTEYMFPCRYIPH